MMRVMRMVVMVVVVVAVVASALFVTDLFATSDGQPLLGGGRHRATDGVT